MYPIVPLNCNSETVPSNNLIIDDESSKLLVPGKVITSTFISQGSLTRPINPETLRGKTPIVQLAVECNNYETIELDKESQQIWMENVHWMRAIRLSEDCHNYNVQLRTLSKQRSFNQHHGQVKLILQTVRPIEAGQELLLWFSEEILAKLQMVFLAPINIQGQNKYICNKCLKIYESPNPLKLHMTLACGRFSIEDIWAKLAFTLNESTLNQSCEKSSFNFQLTPPEELEQHENIAMDLTTTLLTPKQENSINPIKIDNAFSKYSAFTPVIKTNKLYVNNNESFTTNNYQYPINELRSNLCTNPKKVDEEAHIETLVSSLGKSKEGHICLYCGKRYSRKYGLKIHIRTHTGYKPLKCRYCFRPFGDPSNLNKHTRLHAVEGYTPYKCNLCGKVLVRRRDLERHLKSRHTTTENVTGSSPKVEVLSEEDDDIVSVD